MKFSALIQLMNEKKKKNRMLNVILLRRGWGVLKMSFTENSSRFLSKGSIKKQKKFLSVGACINTH